MLLLAGSLFVWLNRPPAPPQQAKVEAEKKPFDAPPGKSGAILTLASGEKVLLDSMSNGTVAMQGRTQLRKLGGQLNYKAMDAALPASAVFYNTMTVPRGRTFKLRLEDGTMVWLNAGSTIRFPTAFTGKERKVELMGEGYFEVAKNASMPFKVEVNGMEVEVLGTHFNINSYNDEPAIRTTLLEGSVKINKNNTTSLLKPGQQAEVNSAGEVRIINNADIDEAVAWKNGIFNFEGNDIQSVMRQIARWYDVDIKYENISTAHFMGTISRNVNMSEVLNMIALTGAVHFKVEGRTITVKR